MCSIDLPDRQHGADLSSKPPGPVSLTVEQRLAVLRNPKHLEFEAVKQLLEKAAAQRK
jgi:hypothetical protein